MTSKERAELRAQANTIDTTLIVGKGGVSDTLIAEAEKLLDVHELVKGKVLEASMLTAREACDALCESLGAEGIQVVGSKFVIWRKSEKKDKKEAAQKAPKPAKPAKKKVNPVKAGIKRRKDAAKKKRDERKKYFHDQAVQAAIERRKQSQD